MNRILMNKSILVALGAMLATILVLSCQSPSHQKSQPDGSTDVVRIDTLPYTTERYRQASEHVMTTMEATDTTAFVASYPVFNEPALDEIIRYALTHSDTADVASAAAEFIAAYDEWVTESGVAHSWYNAQNIVVQQNTPSYVALVSDAQSYTGGAHGNYHTRFIHYDTYQKKEILLTDWVSPERMNELTAIAERIFRTSEGLTPDQALDDYFFEGGRFSLPDNFYIAGGQLHFLYNIYEIKPYSEGQSTLSVPLDEVAHLMTEAAKQAQDEVSNKENLL